MTSPPTPWLAAAPAPLQHSSSTAAALARRPTTTSATSSLSRVFPAASAPHAPSTASGTRTAPRTSCTSALPRPLGAAPHPLVGALCSGPAGDTGQRAVSMSEDELTFPGVYATCHSCRKEWLSGRETRSRSGSRLETGTGADVLAGDEREQARGVLAAGPSTLIHCAGGRWWWWWYAGYATTHLMKRAERLHGRGHSPSSESMEGNFADFEARGCSQTAAYANNVVNADVYWNAGYTNMSADDYEEEEEYNDLELEDELSEDEDEMAVALETSVKELVLRDWARGKVLHGGWVAPADVYYGLCIGGLDTPDDPVTVHPVPWAVSPPPSPPGHATSTAVPAPLPHDAPPATHPGPPAPPPPTYMLAEAVHTTHMHQMCIVLLPTFHNCTRKRASGSAASTSTGASGEGIDTSPVLLTSTLGTTPSPPLLGEHPKDKNAAVLHKERQRKLAKEAQERQPTIAVMPVLDPPRLLHPIPHVSETIAHLPRLLFGVKHAHRCTIAAATFASVAQGAGYTAKPATSTPAPATATRNEGPVVTLVSCTVNERSTLIVLVRHVKIGYGKRTPLVVSAGSGWMQGHVCGGKGLRRLTEGSG
ncbi:hypothetical protein DFH07DRAFT_1031100 [Mycena maculata]|uniref:Uncharacterized protein n=1 Tax=Mycena maculata TaxID=230809 RepID=A0AAD7IZN9_9AGAR|nr:hypothetical protein DFH07DRAFT_1031100 [Mycena maculata]